MIKRDTIVLFIAALCGIFAFLLIFNFLKEATSPRRAIVVTARDIEKGMTLSEDDLTFSRPVKNLDTSDYYLQISDVVGKKVGDAVPKGKGIKRSNVQAPPKKPRVKVAQPKSLPVPPEKSGLSLNRDDLLNLNESIAVGSYMDVMGTVPGSRRTNQAQALVRGAQVVSVKKGNDGEVTGITLAVDPRELQPTFQAISKGKLTTIIRAEPPDDEIIIQEVQVIRGTKIGKKIKFQADGN